MLADGKDVMREIMEKRKGSDRGVMKKAESRLGSRNVVTFACPPGLSHNVSAKAKHPSLDI